MDWKSRKHPSLLLLAVWLILMGMTQFLKLSFIGLDAIMGLIAIVAGALFLLGR